MTSSPLGSRTTLRALIVRFFCTAALVCAATLSAQAQITSTTDATQTPVAGAGHDYLHMINESVNPEIGTVSLSIKVPMPPGRKLNLPFSFQYSSGGALFLVPSWSLGWGARVSRLGSRGVTAALREGVLATTPTTKLRSWGASPPSGGSAAVSSLPLVPGYPLDSPYLAKT